MTRIHRAFDRDKLDFSPDHVVARECSRCGRKFFTHQFAGVSYCSDRCAQQERIDRRREQRAHARERARKARKPGKCEACGAKLQDQIRKTKRFCSDACRQWAYRRRSTP
jgi:endogenous inhibitor of DNA gyrase (YacG/DUF329 family)